MELPMLLNELFQPRGSSGSSSHVKSLCGQLACGLGCPRLQVSKRLGSRLVLEHRSWLCLGVFGTLWWYALPPAQPFAETMLGHCKQDVLVNGNWLPMTSAQRTSALRMVDRYL